MRMPLVGSVEPCAGTDEVDSRSGIGKSSECGLTGIPHRGIVRAVDGNTEQDRPLLSFSPSRS